MSTKRKKDRESAALKIQDLQGFVEECQTESDRATAILCAALLDERLLQLLTTFLIADKKQVDLLLGTEGPAGSFGARIRLAYCLGLTTPTNFDVLMTIKAIRNAFAHHLHGLSFADPDVAKELDKLRMLLRNPPELMKAGRTVYLSATLSAQMELWAKTASIDASQSRCRIPEWKTLVAWQRDGG